MLKKSDLLKNLFFEDQIIRGQWTFLSSVNKYSVIGSQCRGLSNFWQILLKNRRRGVLGFPIFVFHLFLWSSFSKLILKNPFRTTTFNFSDSFGNSTQCFVPGECTQGTLIKQSKTLGENACHRFCKKVHGCEFFTYHPDNLICTALSGKIQKQHVFDVFCPFWK